MTPLTWEHWVARYRARGLTALTPGYPGIAGGTAGVEALRKDPSALAGLGVRATTYNFANDSGPRCFIAGGKDHILLPAVQHENYRNITAYKLFPGPDHFACGEPGWEKVADFVLNWALDPRAGELD